MFAGTHFVDAKPDAVDFYAKFGITAKSAAAGALHAVPSPTPMFISVAKLKAAGTS